MTTTLMIKRPWAVIFRPILDRWRSWRLARSRKRVLFVHERLKRIHTEMYVWKAVGHSAADNKMVMALEICIKELESLRAEERRLVAELKTLLKKGGKAVNEAEAHG